jgi:hypothetical protein
LCWTALAATLFASLRVRDIQQLLDDFAGTLGAHRVPFNDDSSGNFVVVRSRPSGL